MNIKIRKKKHEIIHFILKFCLAKHRKYIYSNHTYTFGSSAILLSVQKQIMIAIISLKPFLFQSQY